MPQQRFLFRSVIALALMVGFYVIALAMAGSFLYLAYAEIVDDGHRSVRAILFLVITGGMILWSIIPRRDVFPAPGPQIFDGDQPELFKVIRDVARATGQAMPDEVYVVGEVNAWVAHRGGSMGVGTRRVMGLGLPLMQALTLSQFRAVLAHEFGHYVGGDTKFAPLIYKTREAMGRTIVNLSEHAGLLHKPFLWYGNLFMRVTQSISRAQELAADALAAKLAGARVSAAALENVHRAAVAYNAYWVNEIVPLLDRGFKPPIAAGFQRFMNVARIDTALKEDVQRELRDGKTDVYDSHPPLRERVRALKAMRGGEVVADEPLVATLLRDVESLEKRVLVAIDEHAAKALQDIRWEETSRVFVKTWRESAKPHAAVLRDIVPEEFGRVASALPTFAARLHLKDVPSGERTQVALGVLGCAFAASLHDNGWACSAEPGEPIVFVRGEHSIQPFDVFPRLMRGELPAQEWDAQCRAAGIGRITLS